MNKNGFAVTPPMGWNSYDYYDTTVNEEQVRANADYMAARLKEFGWEYVVIDIEWYCNDAGTLRDRFQYIPFGDIEMDAYGRRKGIRAAGGLCAQSGAEIRYPYHAGHPA